MDEKLILRVYYFGLAGLLISHFIFSFNFTLVQQDVQVETDRYGTQEYNFMWYKDQVSWFPENSTDAGSSEWYLVFYKNEVESHFWKATKYNSAVV